MLRICNVKDFVAPVGDFLLEPCPFCGSGKFTKYLRYETTVGDRWAVGCLDCMAIIDPGWVQTRSTVRDMWNRRAEK